MDTRPEPSLPSQVEARDGDFWLGLPQSRCQGGATDRAARGDPKLSPSHGAAAVPYLGLVRGHGPRVGERSCVGARPELQPAFGAFAVRPLKLPSFQAHFRHFTASSAP